MKSLFLKMLAIGVVASLAGQSVAAGDGPAGAIKADSGGDVIVHAGRLIDGTSRQIRQHVSIVIHDDRIVSVEDGFVERPGARVIDLGTKTVMPGLIDTHVHLLVQLGRQSPAIMAVTRTPYDNLLLGAANARATLMAGFTSARDVGGYTPSIIALKKGIAAGTVDGPRLWVSGMPLGPTGGHGDLSTGFDPALTKPEWTDGIVDSPDAAVAMVRRRHRDGADLIKIMPSGGVASVGDDPEAQLMTDDEIKAVVNTAHVLHMKVAAHAHGTKAIAAAVRLGVDSIEHGTYGNPETDRLMKERGTYLVPTLIAGQTVFDYAKANPQAMDASSNAKALAVAPVMASNVVRAYRAGVKIAFGTDAGIFQHGMNAREFQLMVAAGIPAIDAILSATGSAAALIGDDADIGSIRPGRFADIIAVDGDPIADITTLQHVIFVMKGGRVFKNEVR